MSEIGTLNRIIDLNEKSKAMQKELGLEVVGGAFGSMYVHGLDMFLDLAEKSGKDDDIILKHGNFCHVDLTAVRFEYRGFTITCCLNNEEETKFEEWRNSHERTD